jgi:3-oxoacyl-[acyl-carrier-protein] synthase-3
MKMVGQDVFRAAIRGLAEIGEQVVHEAGLSMSDVDWFVPHQSNMRILSAVADRWQVGLDRFILMLEATGNTSSASVPIGLDEGLRDGRIRSGQKILMFALGAGISYGAVLLEVG